MNTHSTTSNEGWITWKGRRSSPVAPEVIVEILLRCEQAGEDYEDASLPAGDVEWCHASPKSGLDVVAYRIVEQGQ